MWKHISRYGGNGGSTVNCQLGQYYHSTSGGTLMVVDTTTKKGPAPDTDVDD